MGVTVHGRAGGKWSEASKRHVFLYILRKAPRLGPSEKGFVQLYTGNGKGKTTAALGLALRAAGSGLRVYIAQFAKGIETGEVAALRKFKGRITLRQFGTRSFIGGKPGRVDAMRAAQGLAEAADIIAGGRYDLVVLDELCAVCYCKIVDAKAAADIIASRPAHVEIVITGRNAPKKLVDAADLVTEMREIKHYFSSGVRARKGIEF